MRTRLSTLDYLRGLAAASIMIYHLTGWIFSEPEANTILGKLGIYGVSLFYVLSGLTLYHVYQSGLNNAADYRNFYIKRIFRIFPLLWLAIIGTIILRKTIPDGSTLALNFSGLFGFVAPDNYIAIGSWSIGNELVFYVFFPVLLFLARKNFTLFSLFLTALNALFIFFAFEVLNPLYTLGDQWKDYVNPLNQVALFAGGMAIGYFGQNAKMNRWVNSALCVLALILFIAMPAGSDQITLVTGLERVGFTLLCFILCFTFYKSTLRFPAIIDKPLTWLGEASYSVYLIHPLVYNILSIVIYKMGWQINKPLYFTVNVLLSLIGSYLLYTRFEKPILKLSRHFTAKKVLVPLS